MVKSALFITAGYCPSCHKIAREQIEPVIEQGYDVCIVDGMQEPAIARKYHIDRVPALVLAETPEPDAGDAGTEPEVAVLSDTSVMTEDFLYDFFDSNERLLDFCIDRLEE